MKSDEARVPAGMREVRKKSSLPFYLCAAVWIVYALAFPLYRWYDYLIVLVVSSAVFFLSEKLIPPRKIYLPVQEKPVETGDAAADEMVRSGRVYLQGLRRADENIEDEAVSEKIRRIEFTANRIFDFIEQHPDKAPSIRRFMQYYLPTVLKLLDSYDTMEEQRIEGENLNASMRRIERVLDTMIPAFDKQLDTLFQDKALDISADITVLETLLAQEGLTSSDFASADTSNSKS